MYLTITLKNEDCNATQVYLDCGRLESQQLFPVISQAGTLESAKLVGAALIGFPVRLYLGSQRNKNV